MGFPSAVFRLTPITPTWTGGYNSTTYSGRLGVFEPPVRPTEVKGAMRRAARLMLVSAALILKSSYKVDVSGALSVLDRVFGSAGQAGSSIYRVRAWYDEDFGCRYPSFPRRLRCRDLVVGGGSATCKWEDYTAFVELARLPPRVVYKRMRWRDGVDVLDEFVLRSFLVGLVIFGLGKATARGYGSFTVDLEEFSGMSAVDGVLSEYRGLLESGGDDIHEKLRGFLNNGVRAAGRLILKHLHGDADLYEWSNESYVADNLESREFPPILLKPSGSDKILSIEPGTKLHWGLYIDYLPGVQSMDCCIPCSRIRDEGDKIICCLFFGHHHRCNGVTSASLVRFRAINSVDNTLMFTFIFLDIHRSIIIYGLKEIIQQYCLQNHNM